MGTGNAARAGALWVVHDLSESRGCAGSKAFGSGVSPGEKIFHLLVKFNLTSL